MNNNCLLNLVLILIPLLLSFNKNLQLFKDWSAFIPAVMISGIAGIVIKIAFVHYEIINYSQTELTDISFFEIPIASILFCFSLPYFGLVIYNFLNTRFPKTEFEKYSLALSNILMGLAIAIIFFAYNKGYAVFTFSLLLVLLFAIEYINKLRFMYKFYCAYAILLVFYCLFQVVFAWFNVVTYHIDYTMRFNLINAPFENYFLMLILFLSTVYLFEFFKRSNRGTS